MTRAADLGAGGGKLVGVLKKTKNPQEKVRDGKGGNEFGASVASPSCFVTGML